MQATTAVNQYREQTGHWTRMTGWLNTAKNKTLTDWTVEQLDVQPYQHILEISYGSGYTLSEVARKLKIGFLAGVEESVDAYRKAYTRNKKLIAEDLLQLHIGSIHDIAYPSHYFHTIYGTNIHGDCKTASLYFMKLSRLLKTGGMLVIVFQPAWASSDTEVRLAAEKIMGELLEAGLVGVEVAYKDMHPVTGIAVTGYKS